jgi:pyruvate/2-oxoglutarate/acetoin dehydrogenase E1 component
VRYQDAITDAMFDLSRDPMRRFLGYNVGCGNLANGTLARVPAEQRIETPAAENLMVGLAIGLSLEGYKPVVCSTRSTRS